MNVDSILQEIGAMKTKMNKKEKIVKTPEEAIETIKSNMPTSGYQMLRESLIMAIGSLEKQIPKAPDYEGDGCDKDGNIIYDTWICPNCGEIYEVDYDDYEHCPKCGQAIQWENLEGMEDRK